MEAAAAWRQSKTQPPREQDDVMNSFARHTGRQDGRLVARLALGLMLLLIAAGCTPNVAQFPAAVRRNLHLPARAPVAKTGYPSLAAALTAARYSVRPAVADDAVASTVLWAQNPAHALHSSFSSGGVALTVRLPVTAIMTSDRNRREGETDKGHETLSIPSRYNRSEQRPCSGPVLTHTRSPLYLRGRW